jgi:hypothetical protein
VGRLLFNLANEAGSDAAFIQALPKAYPAETDSLGMAHYP